MAEVVHVEDGEDVGPGRQVAGRHPEDLLPDDAVVAPEDELQGAPPALVVGCQEQQRQRRSVYALDCISREPLGRC